MLKSARLYDFISCKCSTLQFDFLFGWFFCFHHFLCVFASLPATFFNHLSIFSISPSLLLCSNSLRLLVTINSLFSSSKLNSTDVMCVCACAREELPKLHGSLHHWFITITLNAFRNKNEMRARDRKNNESTIMWNTENRTENLI